MPVETAHVLQELAARNKRMAPTGENVARIEDFLASQPLPKDFMGELALIHRAADAMLAPSEDPPKKAKKEKVKARWLKDFLHGQETVGYFKAATALGAVAAPVGGDAFRALTINISPEQDRTPVMDEKGHRSAVSTFEGRRRAGVEIATLIQPNAAGMAPQLDAMLRNVFGKAPATTSVTVTYSIAEDLSASIGNLWKLTGVGHEAAVGVILNEMNLTWGNDAPMTGDLWGHGARLRHPRRNDYCRSRHHHRHLFVSR